MRKLPPEREALRDEAEKLKLAGLGFADIGRQLNVPTTTVQRWLSDYQTPRPELDESNPYSLTGADYGLMDQRSNTHELTLVRSYLAKAHQEGQPAKVVMDLAKHVDDLIRSGMRIEILKGDLLPRSAVLSLGQSIVDIVIEELQSLPGYESIVERIIERIFPAVNNGRADDKEVKRLLGPPKG